MMFDWQTYRDQLMAGIKDIGQNSPGTIKGYLELGAAGAKQDLLGAKMRELISLEVAVTVRCDGCIAVHSEAALRAGATKAEITEALGVAVAVSAGAALVYSTRVMDAIGDLAHAAPTQ